MYNVHMFFHSVYYVITYTTFERYYVHTVVSCNIEIFPTPVYSKDS